MDRLGRRLFRAALREALVLKIVKPTPGRLLAPMLPVLAQLLRRDGSLSSAIIDQKTGGELCSSPGFRSAPGPMRRSPSRGFEEIDPVGHQVATASVNSAEPSR